MSNRNKNQGRQQEKPKADPVPPQQAAATAPPTNPPVDPPAEAPVVDQAAAAATPPVEPEPETPKPRHEYPATLQHCGYPVDALNADKKVWCHGCHREYLPEKLEAWKPASARTEAVS